jgi:zinc protease
MIVFFRKLIYFLFFLPTLLFAQVHQKTLDNGLKIFVKEDHRSPVVVSQVWYRAGSIDEVNGKTGVAHVLEHMMFKGTKTTKPGQFSEVIAAAGGRENAFTGADYTAYFQTLEKSKLPIAMKMESDRMQNLLIKKEEFAKEINVVMEERRWRTDDKPTSQVNELMQSLAFVSHPYGRPIVGWMNDLENMSHEDALEWYENWYAPNNAILVVAGDVKPEEIFELAEKYYGPIPSKKIKERKPQIEAEQMGVRRAEVKAPSKLSYLQMAYKVPALDKDLTKNSTDVYALEVLAGILSNTSASRLNQSLVNDQGLALGAGASYAMITRGGMSLFEYYATPSEATSVIDVEDAIKKEVEKIIQSGVTEDELNRIKTSVIASKVYQQDSVFYQAMQIGQLETIGYPYTLMDSYVENVKKVTSAQIQAVASKYFVDDRLTVVTLDPQPVDPNSKPKGKPHVH